MKRLFSVVVPTYSRVDLLRHCLDALLNQTIDDVDVVVVDNSSPVGIAHHMRRTYGSRVRAIRLEKNHFYCGAVNRGAATVDSPYLAILNDDCVVESDWAEQALIAMSEHADAGAIATVVSKAHEPHLVDSAGSHVSVNGQACNIHWNMPVDGLSRDVSPVFAAAGSCAVYRREAFEVAGRFDEDFIAYFEDIDLGFRLQLLGWRTYLVPPCKGLHVGGATPKTRYYASRLMERNMVWNLIKNMPTQLMTRHVREVVKAQLSPAPLYGGRSAIGFLDGKLRALTGSREMLTKRRRIQRERRVSLSYLEDLLSSQVVGQCHL